MKKLFWIASAAIVLSSCGTQKTIIPRAINTVKSVSLEELNLERKDYEILNTVSAEATIGYTDKGSTIRIEDETGEFALQYTKDKKGQWTCKYNGVLRMGYLNNDYMGTTTDIAQPEDVVRRLAIYRLINESQQYGGDGLIEPTISTNAEQRGDVIMFRTTVTAKIVKLKTDR
ncbi:MAG: hypothetical protein J1D86_01245 [Alistipes sp.]|nr:hypothetical protein [Alistipes sp.]